MFDLGWEWYDDNHTKLVVKFESGVVGYAETPVIAWQRTAKYHEHWPDPSIILEAAGYNRITEEIETYIPLQNEDENSKIALFLKQGDNYKAATAEIDLNGKNFTLENVQFYNSNIDDVIEDASSATKASLISGRYEIMAILTLKGDKSIISGLPVQNS